MNVTTAVEITHAELEAAAYNNAMAAARLGDRTKHAKLWAEYARICRERPAEVVRAAEKAKGIT